MSSYFRALVVLLLAAFALFDGINGYRTGRLQLGHLGGAAAGPGPVAVGGEAKTASTVEICLGGCLTIGGIYLLVCAIKGKDDSSSFDSGWD